MSAPAKRHVCADCTVAPACIECCSQYWCLMHAHCTRHGQHPASWNVVDRVEYDRTKPAVEAVKRIVIAQLEADLEAAEAQAHAAVAAVRASTASPSTSSSAHGSWRPGTTAPPLRKPSLPTFDSLRKRAHDLAAGGDTTKHATPRPQVPRLPMDSEAAGGRSSGGVPQRDEDEDEDMFGTAAASAQARTRGGEAMFRVQPVAAVAAAQVAAGDGDGGAPADVVASSVRGTLAAPPGTPALPADPSRVTGHALRDAVVATLLAALRDGLRADEAASRGGDGVRGGGSSEELLSLHARMESMRPLLASTATAGITALAVAVEAALWQAHPPLPPAHAAAGSGGATASPATRASARDAQATTEAVPTASVGYRTAAREVAAGLRHPGNVALRSGLASGAVSADVVAGGDVSILMPPAMRSEVAEVRDWVSGPIDTDPGAWQPVPAITCRVCREQVVEATPVAGMRDIRKAEVWGSSDMANTTLYKLRCKRCGSTWTTDNLPL